MFNLPHLNQEWPIKNLKDKRCSQNEKDAKLAMDAIQGVEYEEADMPMVYLWLRNNTYKLHIKICILYLWLQKTMLSIVVMVTKFSCTSVLFYCKINTGQVWNLCVSGVLRSLCWASQKESINWWNNITPKRRVASQKNRQREDQFTNSK